MKFKEYFLVTLGGLAVSSLLIVLDVFGASHLSPTLFAMVFVLAVLGAWKKPFWAFWLFLALLPLEKIVLSPVNFPFSIRPYQLAGLVLFIAVALKWATREKDFKFRRIDLFDKLAFLLAIFAFLGTLNSPNRAISFKLALVLASFVALFWLARNFLQTAIQKLEALWFFAVGAVPVVAFGFYQAIAFQSDWPHFETFDARINSTFAEPDWLGIYLAILLALELLFLAAIEKMDLKKVMIGRCNALKFFRVAAYIDVFLISTLLFLTVSRSAWIGGLAVVLAYFAAKYLFDFNKRVGAFIKEAIAFAVIVFLAAIFMSQTGLSTFHFGNRAASSVSGLQKITISCEQNVRVPEQIQNVSELKKYNCAHINLEEIENELAKGHTVKETYRPDPNVEIRKDIYAKSWGAIKQHPIIGQGLGSSAVILGTDERGMGLNTSNIFLEAWLSMGIGGFLILLWFLAYHLGKAKLELFAAKKAGKELEVKKYLGLAFVFITAGAIIVPNLFNSGLLLGFFWVWLAGVASVMNIGEETDLQ